MKLIGQFDSPFVRRVAITLHAYDLPFDRDDASVFNDFNAVLAVNPLGRVPALVLDEGVLLCESLIILDYLDRLVAPGKTLTPTSGAQRWAVLSLVGVAHGLAEKSVEYRTETSRRPADKVVTDRGERIHKQILQSLAWLESKAEAAAKRSEWLCGAALTQADIAAAVAYTHLSRKSPSLLPAEGIGYLASLTERCESLDCFRAAPFEG